MPINDMVPLAQNIYRFSLQLIPFQHQSGERSNKATFFASVCQASIWRLRPPPPDGDSGIRRDLLLSRGY